jgi:hypothetical protein
MITHVIYHIPGRKVGCTNNFERRKRYYLEGEGKLPEGIEILEELHDKTDQEAGDIEWQWADRFGYKRENHYTIILDFLRKRGKIGGKIGGRKGSREDKSKAGTRALKLGVGIHALTHEQNIKYGKQGGRRAFELGLGIHGLSFEDKVRFAKVAGKKGSEKGGCILRAICPHCGLESNLMILKRWHFDNCRKRSMVRGN